MSPLFSEPWPVYIDYTTADAPPFPLLWRRVQEAKRVGFWRRLFGLEQPMRERDREHHQAELEREPDQHEQRIGDLDCHGEPPAVEQSKRDATSGALAQGKEIRG